jgi:hypothetical protein
LSAGGEPKNLKTFCLGAAGIPSFLLAFVMGFWPEVLSDDFGEVKDLEVVALGVVGGVAKHDRAVGASSHHCGCLGFGELGKSEFVHALFRPLSLVVGYEQPGAAGSTALRVLPMVRGFHE